jgi:asparagine synthase (glutamine-hydrolysing)
MCGIAGLVDFKGTLRPDTVVPRMLTWLNHRGPDEHGVWHNDSIAIGTARLAIIDLVSGGQPIANEDETIWACSNGEIYNFRALRLELQRKGHHFRTQTDTEVIVHAYEEWHEKFVQHLKGMFGIVVLDLNREELYLARDLAGEKPLFYTLQPNFFGFASEIKPLLYELPISMDIDPLAIDSFFAFSRPVNTLCAFRSIQKLMPRQILRLDIRSGTHVVSEYWKPPSSKLALTEDEAETELMRLLEDSIQHFVVADVPVGAFLSGGTDSGLVVAMMRKFFDQPVKTFTAIYDDAHISEQREAKQVAEILGTEHHEVLIKPQDVVAALPQLIWHLEEPFGDASFLPAYFVSKKAREFVKVALTGDGGDELFGGYDSYLAWRLLELYRRLPSALKSAGQSAAERIPLPLLTGYPRLYHYAMGVKRVTTAASETEDIAAFLSLTGDGSLSNLLTPEISEQLLFHRRETLNGYEGGSALDRILVFQFRGLLPELFFTKVDRMSMANSLECRSPLVYRDIVEFALRLPAKFKVKGTTRKYLLKRVAERFLPKEIVYRPKKGFTIPFYRWLREDLSLRRLVEEYALSKLPGYLADCSHVNYQHIRQTTQDYLAGKHNHWVLPWKALCFGLWRETYMVNGGRRSLEGFSDHADGR